MNEDPAAIRSETRALDALIQETIAQAEASTGQGSADRMLFLGNRHQSFPTAVVNDPVLEPVDKLVWMVIMLSVRETGGSTAFPGYEAIGRMVNVSSRSTIRPRHCYLACDTLADPVCTGTQNQWTVSR